MEGNLLPGNLIPGGVSFGGFDLQKAVKINHHHNQNQANPRQGSMFHPAAALPERKNSCSDDDDDTNLMEDTERGKKLSTWQRVKWSDTMVRLLITAVSYMGEDGSAENSRRKNGNMQKKGKWKLVSKVMAERGHFVSPQQCEDKFNDLNKRYKRLNEILGRGTSCEVVENPVLLDRMDITEKLKDEVRKILSSKHLYYEEMCSYHNCNRLHLPPDPELQHSLRLALGNQDDNFDEEDRETELDDHDEFEENPNHNHTSCGDHNGTYGALGESSKRKKQCEGLENVSFGSMLKNQNVVGDMNQVFPAGMKQRSIQLEEQLLQIESQRLELEKERFKWQRSNEKKDRELEMMRMENERMKLENEQMALELKRKEMGTGNN